MLITVTGLDEKTSMVDIDQMLLRPCVELGFLYSASPEGRNRYPGFEYLLAAMKRASGRCALHVCGGKARAQLIGGELNSLVAHAARVQVNGHITSEEAKVIAALIYPKILITQHTASSTHLLDVTADNHALLLDGSGGRGLSPERWESPSTQKTVGFAGGLGNDNLLEELPRIFHEARTDWWVDMETKLRVDSETGDWFSTELALGVVDIFERFLVENL